MSAMTGSSLQKGKSGGNHVPADRCSVERPKQMCDDARDEDERNARQQMRDRDQALMGGKANLRGAAGAAGVPTTGYRGAGADVRMTIDPALDVPSPSYQIAEGE